MEASAVDQPRRLCISEDRVPFYIFKNAMLKQQQNTDQVWIS